MIRTNIVTLSAIKGVAYRQKLMSGGSGIVIVRQDCSQPGIASISKTSGEAIPTANTPKDVYPLEAFTEAMELTIGLPYAKRGSVVLKEDMITEEPAPVETAAEEVVVDSKDYKKVVEMYIDKNGKLSYALLNRDMIRFAHQSKVVRKMIQDNAKQDEVVTYTAGAKFRNITGNRNLSDEQVMKIVELLDEVSPKGVFKEFKEEIRKSYKK